jgi:hypothetical protein
MATSMIVNRTVQITSLTIKPTASIVSWTAIPINAPTVPAHPTGGNGLLP